MAGWTNLTPSAAALAAGNAYLYEDAGALKYQGTSGSPATIVSAAGVLQAAGGGSSGDVRLNTVSGYYYGPATQGSTTAGSTLPMTADRMYAVPFLVGPTGFTANSIGVSITTAAASSAIRLMIYNSNAAGTFPDTLLLNASTVDSSTTGDKEINTISQALSANTLYWLVAVSNGAPTIRARNSATLGVPMTGISQLSSTQGSWYKDSAGSYTTPPTYGTPTSVISPQMAILVRAA